jgi:hypothetical protein
MQLAHQLRLLHSAEEQLAAALRAAREGHAAEVDVFHICGVLAQRCDARAQALAPFAARYGDEEPSALDEPHRDLFGGARSGPLGLLRDLSDLYVMTCECEIAWTLVVQAAQGARDRELLALAERSQGEATTQAQWLRTRSKQAAPQALVVA